MTDFERLLGTLGAGDVSFVIVGGIAATVHGSARLTSDVDIIYDRSPENIERLVAALAPLDPYLRGAPPGLPFQFDVGTVRRGLNFTLVTSLGALDLSGEVPGVGDYTVARRNSVEISLFGSTYCCLDLEALIVAKRAAGRPKDLDALAELESLRHEAK